MDIQVRNLTKKDYVINLMALKQLLLEKIAKKVNQKMNQEVCLVLAQKMFVKQ